MSVATRSRSMTAHSSASSSTSATVAPSSSSTATQSDPRFNNFRPARYQTKEELDRFFGTTSVQKREQRLRVRESDGQVYFDWIEKDEWQHLLATGSLTSPNSPADQVAAMDRRRSSVATFMTLSSPLRPSSPMRRASLASGISPLVGRFGEVEIGSAGSSTDGEDVKERRGRKRSNSALVARSEQWDDQLPQNGGGGEFRDWIQSPGFKRRQSDGVVSNPRDSYYYGEEEDQDAHSDNVRIRISRLPLGHRKLDQDSLDQAFGTHNPLFDLSPNATIPTCNNHKPATLHIPTVKAHQGLIEIDNAPSPTCSSYPGSPNTIVGGGSTFDAASGVRRGTFGDLLPPSQPAPTGVQVAAMTSRRIRVQSDTATTPPSSAAMEILVSPTPSSTSQNSRTLRHTASFETPRQPSFSQQNDTAVPSPSTVPCNAWAQRQRWHSAEASTTTTTPSSNPPVRPERKIRAVRSVASLHEATDTAAFRNLPPPLPAVSIERTRKISNSSEGSSASDCFTPLAPRTGAKKFDRTRIQHLQSLPPATSTSPASTIATLPPLENPRPMRDPVVVTAPPPQPSVHLPPSEHVAECVKPKVLIAGGLRTGPEVYEGVDIPCASIYLYSDPEDNFEPALALSMSASKLKKLKKKSNSTNVSSNTLEAATTAGHARSASASSTTVGMDVQQHAKGSSRWWSHILHN
ncbi:uncharacterized protein UTRI_06144_B [Ustilago trichophora]|uniref:Uncharacterized protein n=1 Tax=Ustilago trichophora TaxID=86804 RepID=A0A5C3EHJ5_9BASI|nr:uncharacterized protein UTRI_06144_B [Ustilago trichophora]